MDEIVLGIRAVNGQVAGMDHQIGPLGRDPCRERRPVAGEMPLLTAKMRVGNLDHS